MPDEYVHDYYGLSSPLPEDLDLGRDFEVWRSQLRRPVRCQPGHALRYELETFMQRKGVMPKKWMSARLGMTEASMDNLLSHLADIQMRPSRYVVYPDLIAKSFYDDLVPDLLGHKFITFLDEYHYCNWLHSELKKRLKIEIDPLFCQTSEQLGENPKQFARDFDCITLKPVSAKHQVWLDFRKPLNLRPDPCSKLFYAENRQELQPYSFG